MATNWTGHEQRSVCSVCAVVKIKKTGLHDESTPDDENVTRTYDYIIAGGGIIGLAVARALTVRSAQSRILILEKEAALARHASGRNSGVLHSGVYYPPDSLKAKFCAEGAREWRDFAQTRGLALLQTGKVIVATRAADDAQIDLLFERGRANGAQVEILDEAGLRACEPLARTSNGRALWVADTAVIDPAAVVNALADELRADGVDIELNAPVIAIDDERAKVRTTRGEYGYGRLINAGGLYAERLAWQCGAGDGYRLIPFKGLYRELAPECGLQIRRPIYPVPDLRMPFLGVHFTPSVAGKVYVGPTAIPALGRENYSGLQGMSVREIASIGAMLLRLLYSNEHDFRKLAVRELSNFSSARLVKEAQQLVPALRAEHLRPSKKVGIRAQLVDVRARRLVMDFLIEDARNSTHILNAVSPGFTCALPFGRYVVAKHLGG